MSKQLGRFWSLIETNFPLGGPRRHLIDLLGDETAAAIEGTRLLSYQRMSDTYPCPHPGGDGCPRQVIELEDGSYHAVCGNDPRECDDLVLQQKAVEHLGIAPKVLCENIARALQVKARFEEIDGLRSVYRIGTFIPDPGVRQPVFLAVRCSEQDYAEVLDALRSRQERGGFAVLVPTDRFVADSTARQMASLGIPLLPLDDVVGIDDGKLTALVDPLTFFEGIGQRGPGMVTTAPSVVARALVCNGDGRRTWRELDEQGYQDLVAAADDYLIFADERGKTVTKGSGARRTTKAKVQVAYFRMIHAAANKTAGYFDPSIDGPADQMSDKQVFQRARKVFDIKHDDNKTWTLFDSEKPENHAVYRLNPDSGTAFAFVFLPAP